MISYARVLAEVDISVKPLEYFEVKLPSGTVYTQYVYYKNMPKFYKNCYMSPVFYVDEHAKTSYADKVKKIKEISPNSGSNPKAVGVQSYSIPNNLSSNPPPVNLPDSVGPELLPNPGSILSLINDTLVVEVEESNLPLVEEMIKGTVASEILVSDAMDHETVYSQDDGFQEVLNKRNKGTMGSAWPTRETTLCCRRYCCRVTTSQALCMTTSIRSSRVKYARSFP